MNVSAFVRRQITHIRWGGWPVIARKTGKASRLALALPFYVLAVPVVIMIRLIRPWLLVRLSALNSGSLGHLAADTELYLCEREAGLNQPEQRRVDLLFIPETPCNRQLAAMWKRVLRIWPDWILAPIYRVDKLMPGNGIPEVRDITLGDRDVHNLLDRYPPHLEFTPQEEARGQAEIRAMGIPEGGPFVCLNVRDKAWNAYCDAGDASTYENSYRDTDVQNYVLAAEALADRGYFVIRMGAIVREAINTNHPGVIDYAINGMRSDFMDIYLGAKCEFCISAGSGFDSVPRIFRRPIAFANYAQLGELITGSTRVLTITQHYYREADNRELTLGEIVTFDTELFRSTSEYHGTGVRLIENSPEEIRDLALEMAERLKGTWRPHEEDEALQRRFREIFLKNAPASHAGHPFYGEIRSRLGADFLRANRAWLN